MDTREYLIFLKRMCVWSVQLRHHAFMVDLVAFGKIPTRIFLEKASAHTLDWIPLLNNTMDMHMDHTAVSIQRVITFSVSSVCCFCPCRCAEFLVKRCLYFNKAAYFSKHPSTPQVTWLLLWVVVGVFRIGNRVEESEMCKILIQTCMSHSVGENLRIVLVNVSFRWVWQISWSGSDLPSDTRWLLFFVCSLFGPRWVDFLRMESFDTLKISNSSNTEDHLLTL